MTDKLIRFLCFSKSLHSCLKYEVRYGNKNLQTFTFLFYISMKRLLQSSNTHVLVRRSLNLLK